MTFETAAKLFKQRLTNLGYKIKDTTIDSCEFFYIENYYDSINLFKIDYDNSSFLYSATPLDYAWTSIHNYTFYDLKELYELSKNYSIDAKKLRVNKKLIDIEKVFQDDKL